MKKIIIVGLLLVSIFLFSACAKQKPENLVGQGSAIPQQTKESSLTAKLINDDYVLGNQDAPAYLNIAMEKVEL